MYMNIWYMFMYLYIHIHICVYMYRYIYAHRYSFLYILARGFTPQLYALAQILCVWACLWVSEIWRQCMRAWNCLCVCACACILIFGGECLCVHMHGCVGVYEYICICLSMYVCIYIYQHACIYVCMYLYVYVHVLMHASMHVCLCLCMYVCMYICVHKYQSNYIRTHIRTQNYDKVLFPTKNETVVSQMMCTSSTAGAATCQIVFLQVCMCLCVYDTTCVWVLDTQILCVRARVFPLYICKQNLVTFDLNWVLTYTYAC